MDELEDGYACGLDLGTTFSCIGVFRNGGVEIIPNRNGDKITPSIVTILDDKILKGEETLENLVKDYDSSIYAIKRFIGRNFNGEKLNDEKLKQDIELAKFPFNLIQDKTTNHLMVEIKKNGTPVVFTLEEISSFIIKKMVENAEEYLDRKIKKLVITVPANFTDSQRKSTEQAAELAGVEVLRIINEPTAAALAYGLQEKNEENKDGKILVFDLGGGTFDVTILQITKDKESNNEKDKAKKNDILETKGNQLKFDVLATNGDKFLGGEDFDNKLADDILDKFCKDNDESKEEVRKDKKAIKRLKIACENIKKVLSYNEQATLCINHFYNNKDIDRIVTKKDFETLCDDLFEKIMKPLDDALIDKKITEQEIKQIILVGGSTRIPKIKEMLKKKFPNTNINDTINPDETVAFGATLMAAKIIIKDKFTSEFNLMDITPFSLGTNVLNNSSIPEIKDKGDLMSVIIKRGTKIPIRNAQTFSTVENDQTSVSIDIYEGEKKYVKYNHLLKKASLGGLAKKPAGEVKVEMELSIDVNGILSVKAKEVGSEGKSDNKVKFDIKNDGINLTKDEMEAIKKKNEKYLSSIKSERASDFYNLKESLKEYQEAYKETNIEEEKINLLKGYNGILEELIDRFDKNFDNETIVEKFYIYVKQLFTSYIKIFNMNIALDKGDQITIIENIKKYANIFTELSSGYLDDLMEILKNLPKKIFYEIVVIILEKSNEYGIKCLKEKKKFSRYNSMKHFERTNNIFNKYIYDIKNILKKGCNIRIKQKCEEQLQICNKYLNDINSNIILLCEDALKKKQLIFTHSGFSAIEKKISNEEYQIVLETYEKMLPQYRNKKNIEEALILANMIKINFELLGYTNYKLYYKWSEDCEFISKKLEINPQEEWYSDFFQTYNKLKKYYSPMTENEMKSNIKRKYEKEFELLDEKFNKESIKGFIHYILKKVPYEGYENDIKNKSIDFNNVNQELIFYLSEKYHPNHYKYKEDDEKSQLNYCLIEKVDSLINKLNSSII